MPPGEWMRRLAPVPRFILLLGLLASTEGGAAGMGPNVTFLAQSPEPGESYVGTPLSFYANYTIEDASEDVRVRIFLDHEEVTSRASMSRGGFFFEPPRILGLGLHVVTVEFYAENGASSVHEWEFSIRRSEPRGGLSPEMAIILVWLGLVLASFELLMKKE